MSSFGNFLEKALLRHAFGGPDYDRPETLYFGLSTSHIAEDEAGYNISEPSGGGYERQALPNIADNWNEPELLDPEHDPNISHKIGHIILDTDITFPEPTSDWGTITHFFVMDGFDELIIYGQFFEPIPADENSEPIKISAGELIITLD